MAFLAENAQYIVLVVALVVWFGIYAYLFRIDAKIKALENQTKK